MGVCPFLPVSPPKQLPLIGKCDVMNKNCQQQAPNTHSSRHENDMSDYVRSVKSVSIANAVFLCNLSFWQVDY